MGLNDSNIRRLPTLIPLTATVVKVAAGSAFSMLLTSTSQVYMIGSNFFGQIGLETNGDYYLPTLLSQFNNVTDIGAGTTHSFINTKNGEISTIFGTGSNSVNSKLLKYREDNYV